MKVAGRWVYLYRAIDQYGQVIDVLVSEKRDLAATRRFFTRALDHGTRPSAVTTDKAPAYPRVLDELVPAACHLTEQYGNNLIEADHGRLKARLRPMRGLKQLRSIRWEPETSETRPRCGYSDTATTHQPSLPARGDAPMQQRRPTSQVSHHGLCLASVR